MIFIDRSNLNFGKIRANKLDVASGAFRLFSYAEVPDGDGDDDSRVGRFSRGVCAREGVDGQQLD
jgi:hypothetical protein